ncbi:glycine--tRNA ligase subunit beta [Kamptonema cortianum]|nr:glycine--tRNA ligase subunit beta [Kamptonema cortianum]
MPDLLFELGCEELPASTVAKSCAELADLVQKGLFEADLAFGMVQFWGTPRRLILSVAGIQDRQEDKVSAQRGPAIKTAFDDAGNPTKALEGFCRGHGVTVDEVRRDGDYVWVDKKIAGRPAGEILSELLPNALRSMAFDKTMRWGSHRMRFVRPIRWILASLDGNLVEFEIEGVRSGLTSRGHRFDFPEEFPASRLDALLAELRQRNVEPDSQVREQKIRDQAVAVAEGVPDLPASLVQENVYLTEWPTAQQGRFSEKYLNLPEPVLVTAMAKHQRFFPVRNASGEITNRFVAVRNSGEEASVVAGNEWVLNARFNDAQFFYEEDQKRSLAEFLEETDRMLFQEKLGTVRARADRLSRLAALIAEKSGADAAEIEFAQTAGLYAKADLATGLVNELSSLQGVIGGVYARTEGFPEPVCQAISAQYDLSHVGDEWSAGTRTGVRLLVADQLDKLAGYLGLGLIPKGSSDPFGLRRAVTMLVEAAWWWKGHFPNLNELLSDALAGYSAELNLSADGAYAAMADVLKGRYEALLPEARHDLLQAAFLDGSLAAVGAPTVLRKRLQILEKLAGDDFVIQTLTRPLNILAAARRKSELDNPTYSPERMGAEGKRLGEAIGSTDLPAMLIEHEIDRVVETVRALVEPINAFFDSTMVMDEDLSKRALNFGLLLEVERQLMAVGDFTKVVIDG